MSRVCAVCGKGNMTGNNVSHANNKTKKVSRPNIHKQTVEINGKVSNEYVCTTCLKTSKKTGR